MSTFATDATKLLADFARRVADADRAPAGSTAARVQRLFARAALVRQWPAINAAFAGRPPTDPALTIRARDLAVRCVKKQKHGMLSGWPAEAKELLNEAADRLGHLADTLDALATPSGPLADLDRTVSAWAASDPLAVALVKLETELAGRTEKARGLLDSLSDTPPGHGANHFDGKLASAAGWTPDARAAAVAVCALCERLADKTSDHSLWEWVCKWADGWFAAAGVSGKLLPGEIGVPGAVVESFPLATGKRVYLAVAGSGPGEEASSEPHPDWPRAVSRIDNSPFDAVIGEEGGRVVVSDGPLSPAVAAFAELFAGTADRSDWWGDGRWRRARELSKSSEPTAVAELAGRWLDECSPSDAETELVCGWAEACGLEVVRSAGAGPGVDVRSVFGSKPAGEVVATNHAGFRHGGIVLRPAVAEVSLGDSPPGFDELQRAADKLPPTELKAMVVSLRAAAEGDYLREAVLQLYTDYHGDAGDTARAAAARAAAEVGERLADLLHRGYDLFPFHPTNLHDHPGGWVSVAPGSQVLTGAVRRVLRPGLQDGGGNLRIPAVAEVE